LAADAQAKKAALDKMKMDKLVLSKQVSDERSKAARKMKVSEGRRSKAKAASVARCLMLLSTIR